MIKINFSQLGWVVAVGLAAVMVSSGFQAPTDKFAVADLQKIVESSDFYKSNETTYNAYVQKRKDLIDYLNQYPVITSDQVTRMKDLSLKEDVTSQEKAELERIKADAKEQDARNKELVIKANPTPEERTLLQEFARRNATMGDLLSKMNQDFVNDIQAKKEQIMATALDKAREAVKRTGKAQGYTVIYSTAAAVYAANDLTDDAIKAMNAK